MGSTSVTYRVRVRNATDTGDALVLTSLRGGTNPVIAKAPTGDGQELDPVTGVIATGQYSIDIADPVIVGSSPPSRVVTSQLFDANGRQLLLSRRCYIEESNDGGSTWPLTVIAGYLMNYQLTDAVTWTFSVGDTRRIQNTLQAWDGVTGFGTRGALFGGPLAGGGWGPVNDRGGWKFKVVSAGAGSAPYFSASVELNFVSGYRGINDHVSRRYSDFLGSGGLVEQVNQTAQAYFSPMVAKVPASSGRFGSIDSGYGFPGFPGLTLRILEYIGAANNGLFIPGSLDIATGSPAGTGPAWLLNALTNDEIETLDVIWPDALALPTVGQILSVSVYTSTPTTTSPVYVDAHPVDIAATLYAQAGIPFDNTSAINTTAALGDTLRVALRVTTTQTLQTFLEQVLFGPFGFSTRTNAAGVLEFFVTRLKSATPPSVTIGTADLQDASGIIFENDEATVYSSVRLKTKMFWAYAPNTQTDTNSRPLDSVIEQDVQTVVVNADANAFVTREIVYEIPGYIHEASAYGNAVDLPAYTNAIALEIFDRFGRGGPVCDALAINAASDTGFGVGDLLYIEPAHFPNANYRFGDNAAVGPRIMQILRRSETPKGPLVKVIDAGSNVTPGVAPTITIAGNPGAPRTVAAFTITNAATINAAANLVTAVQVGSGASAPTNGVNFARYAPGTCPTAAVNLPAMTPGTKVWVRARTENQGGLPSAWTAWTSFTLTAISFVTGLGASPIYQNAAQINWTPANNTDLVDVYLFEGSSPPADWSASFMGTMLASTASALMRNLDGPSVQYQVAVAHRDPSTGANGVLVTGTFTTNSASIGTAPTPLAFSIMPTTQDASLQSGITLALYAANPIYDLVIERAPDVSGSPGTFVFLSQVAGRSQYYTDWLPNDGVKRWYRIKARLSGETDSAYLAAQSGIPGGVLNVQPIGAGVGIIPVTTAPAGKIRRLAAVLAAGTHSGYTPGTTTTRIEFEGNGAGGGGGQFSSSGNVGGGGGEYAFGAVDVSPGDTYDIVVGAGGAGSTTGSSTNGGDTKVTRVSDSHVVIQAVGGKAGDDASNGGGGSGGVGDVTINGESNSSYDDGYASNSGLTTILPGAFVPQYVSARGGDSPRGGFGGFIGPGVGNVAPTIPGGGGGAQTFQPAGSNTKVVQNGADGICLVWEWS